MTRVAVIDYGMSNVDSIVRALEECGASVVVSSEKRELEKAAGLVLPGVGTFERGMQNIRQRGLDETLDDLVVQRGRPFLGICLGMQLMASAGTESPTGEDISGLGWIGGRVVRLVPRRGERIPHVGWNEARFDAGALLFKGVDVGKDFYFVHSYHLSPAREDDVLATTPYCGTFVSAVRREHMLGVQFHPEKSQKPGFNLLKNFLGFLH